jgi:hypothetical protein
MAVREGKIRAAMPESGNVQPDVDRSLSGRTIGGETEMPVINGKFGLFNEYKSL